MQGAQWSSPAKVWTLPKSGGKSQAQLKIGMPAKSGGFSGPSVISLYLKDGEGMSPTNLARLGQVHGFVKSLKVPWIILGDFNMGPDILDQETSWTC